MGLTTRITNALTAFRDVNPPITWNDYVQLVSFNSNVYLAGALNQTIKGHQEELTGTFEGNVQQAYRANGVVFACMLARLQLFTEARFQFQELRNGRPGALYGSPALNILEHPWQNGITADLLAKVISFADTAGTAYVVRRSATRLVVPRPDWFTIILASMSDPEVQAGDLDAEIVAFIYYPGGKNSGRASEVLLREQVAMFAPIPDPLASFRGMSWLTPIAREISADQQMTDHKRQYLLNGATPNMTVAIDKDLQEAKNPKAFSEWVEAFKKTNPSSSNWERYKTWYLAGGTTVTKVGSNMQEIDFKSVQGAGETRIAAAAGVPPVIVGLSEGLQAATYSNYGQARRRFADNTMRPLWRNMAGSLETIVPPPQGSRLWYDDRDIQALAEDKKDLAEVRNLEASRLNTIITAGYKADAALDVLITGDWSVLKGQHTGLFSVQLQAPGSTKMPAGEVPGESPVGPGTKPEIIPVGDTSTKPLSDVNQPVVAKRDALLLLSALAAGEAPIEVIE